MRFDPDRLDRRDPAFIRRLMPVVRAYNQRYVRLRVEGVEHLEEAPALLVGNHNGGIFGPDLPATMGTVWEARGPETPVYGLAHDFAMRHVTPLGRVLQKVGAVRGCPENASRVLATGGQALVYPGGDLDAYRPARLRDRVVFGSRTGFVRVAQAARAPVVPVVAHGAHRSAWIFSDGARVARRLGLPRRLRIQRFPLALALPWGLAAGPWVPYLPLPFPIRLRILPPMSVTGVTPEAARDEVHRRMQLALHELAV